MIFIALHWCFFVEIKMIVKCTNVLCHWCLYCARHWKPRLHTDVMLVDNTVIDRQRSRMQHSRPARSQLRSPSRLIRPCRPTRHLRSRRWSLFRSFIRGSRPWASSTRLVLHHSHRQTQRQMQCTMRFRRVPERHQSTPTHRVAAPSRMLAENRNKRHLLLKCQLSFC